jgi:hypothetical protein
MSRGKVIAAFGSVRRGRLAVRRRDHLQILMVVQFMVVTKGAGRVSEVAARFTLDAMPGKQMAIDSDLNAGLITRRRPRQRREEIAREADFYGAMDGASKFVKGDAIAGIIITAINVLGGFAVGMIEKGWPVGETARSLHQAHHRRRAHEPDPELRHLDRQRPDRHAVGRRTTSGWSSPGSSLSKPRGLIITGIFLGSRDHAAAHGPALRHGSRPRSGWAFARREGRVAAEAGADGRGSCPIRREPPPVEDLLKVDTARARGRVRARPARRPRRRGATCSTASAPCAGSSRSSWASSCPRSASATTCSSTHRVPRQDPRQPRRAGATEPGHGARDGLGNRDRHAPGQKPTEPAFGLDAWWIDPACGSAPSR